MKRWLKWMAVSISLHIAVLAAIVLLGIAAELLGRLCGV